MPRSSRGRYRAATWAAAWRRLLCARAAWCRRCAAAARALQGCCRGGSDAQLLLVAWPHHVLLQRAACVGVLEAPAVSLQEQGGRTQRRVWGTGKASAACVKVWHVGAATGQAEAGQLRGKTPCMGRRK